MLQLDRRGDVLHVTLDRPDSYNAINPELRDRLLEVLAGLETEGVRAVVLAGRGRGFCSGADLRAPRPKRPGLGTTQLMRQSTQRLAAEFLACPVPVISAVHGTAAGIGLTLALGADICVAADDARFLPAFVERGIVPDGAIAFWMPRIIGMARTKDFLMRGRPMSAVEAERLGLVAMIVPPEQVTATAGEIAEEVAAQPTGTLSLLKQMLLRSFETDLSGIMTLERLAQGVSATTEDALEGTAAFLEKRAPDFKGR